MIYKPVPIDTSHVSLPPELDPLVERLAEHVHDLWAARRIAQGWTWGPTRDEVRKMHPNLRPYSQLADEEKELDRGTAIGTIKAITLFGFQVRHNKGHP